MIEISLLPEGMRKKKQMQFDLSVVGDRKIQIIAGGGVLGVLILLLVVFSLGASIRKGQAARLLKREQEIAPQKSNAEAISKEVSTLKAKMVVLDEITKREFLWAEKLNRLSNLILPGIWFTRMRTDSENRLIVEGSVISKKEEAMASVGKFMKDVREDKKFFKDFSNIKLESVQRKSLDERDVVDFKIVLYFR